MSAAPGCARCASPLEDGDLRCAVCALPVPAAVVPAAAERARVLRCRECNAAIAFSPDAQAPRCAFCGAVMAVEQPIDPVEEARIRVPFAVGREAANASLRGWLSSRGWFAPRALANEAVIDSLAPLYWAGWLVDARVSVTWTADSDAGSRRSAWAPHSGQFETACNSLVIPASRGLTSKECGQLVPYYDLARAVNIISAGSPPRASRGAPGPQADLGDHDGVPDAADAVIESFDAQRSAARALVHETIDSLAKIRAEPHIPGSRYRNIHVACLVDALATERAALPAWVLAYRYRDRTYRAVVHGQRDGIVIGKAPLDAAKIAWLVAAGLAVVAAIALFVLLRR